MKNLTTITISFLAMILAGCNFYADVDADWNAGDGAETSECDDLFIILQGEDDTARRAELAGEYARCAGDDSDDGTDYEDPRDCVREDGTSCEDPNPDECNGVDCLPDIDCEEIQALAQGVSLDEALQFCTAQGYSEDFCAQIREQCLDHGGNDPSNDVCEMAYNALADFGIEADSITREEALQYCESGVLDQAQMELLGGSTCEEVATQCFPTESGPQDPQDPQDPDQCDSLIQQASGMGVDAPNTPEEAAAIRAQCEQVVATDVCDQIIACYGF